MFQDQGLKRIHEITMLIIGCGDEVLVMFDPNHPKRGWGFPSTRVGDGEHRARAALRAATEKTGIDFTNHRPRLANAKEKGGISFSAFFIDVDRLTFDAIEAWGTRGETMRKIPKNRVGQYVTDPGRRYLAGAKVTGIPV